MHFAGPISPTISCRSFASSGEVSAGCAGPEAAATATAASSVLRMGVPLWFAGHYPPARRARQAAWPARGGRAIMLRRHNHQATMQTGIVTSLEDLAARIPDGCKLVMPKDVSGP